MKRRYFHCAILLVLTLVFTLGASPTWAKAKATQGCECDFNTSPVQFPLNPTECQFHLYSWLLFFEMVEDDVYLSLPRDIDLFAPAGVSPPKNPSFKPKPPHLTPLAKDVQAGSHRPLFSQSNQEVLYGLRFAGENYTFTVQNNLYNEKGYCPVAQAATKAQKAKPPQPPPAAAVLPQDSVELKLAWLKVDSCQDPKIKDNYICTTSESQGDVALVGLHIVSKPAGQPNWVWSTFEHVDNAPACQDVRKTHSERAWTFFPKNGKCDQVCPFPFCGKGATCGCTSKDCPPDSTCCNYFPPSAENPAVPICRTTPIDQQGTPPNGCIVASLNSQEPAAVKKANLPPAFAKYQLVGTLWFKDDKPAGSTQLANTTMESYLQKVDFGGKRNAKYNWGSSFSCKGCHTTSVGIKPMQSSPNGGNTNNKLDRSFSFNRILNWMGIEECSKPSSTADSGTTGGASAGKAP